jgi:hypothetical protein
MKILYSSLIAIIAFVVLAAAAIADPGTTWEKKINPAGRFQVLQQFRGEAVFDKETGRVWERSPSSDTFEWRLALAGTFVGGCYNKIVGGRKGWRAPTAEELSSLVAPRQTSPSLPIGHPFTNIDTSGTGVSGYWTSTTVPGTTSGAEVVEFLTGTVSGIDKTGLAHVWCVRGGQGHDGQ